MRFRPLLVAVTAILTAFIVPADPAQVAPAIDELESTGAAVERADRLGLAHRRAVIIGDSAIAGIRWNRALGGFQGFDADHRLESCRRLFSKPSCRGRENRRPPTVYVELRDRVATPRPGDVLVIATGYNDWQLSFATDAAAVLRLAESKGFATIAWVTYRDSVTYTLPSDSDATTSNYAAMNAELRRLVASGDHPGLQLWDLDTYTDGAVGWFFQDGVHEQTLGSWGVADWISRHMAHLDARPCPEPWFAGGSIEDPCPNPDNVVPFRGLPSISALYGI